MIFKRCIRLSLATVIFLSIQGNTLAQDINYRRSSLYSILICHPEKNFGKDIDTVFRMVPIPDKFDDHNLKVRAINAAVVVEKKQSDDQNTIEYTIEPFLKKNDVAKRIVSKWFDRQEGKGKDGTFDMNLIVERGLYDADYFDYQVASHSVRGQSLLADAGEELIGNTYVMFNDIQYVDKQERSALVSTGISIIGAVASEFTSGLASNLIDLGARTITDITEDIAGFRVSITSYLYKLRWDEETAAKFYSEYYMTEPDPEKKSLYDREKDLFHLDYVGSHSIVTGNTTLGGVRNKNDMIRKVCQRAIEKNIAELQRKYEEFRVKTPLFSTAPLSAKIGLKEDISENSRFEVLEAVENEDGRTEYKRRGVVKPVAGKIWDNRFMAEFEEENAGNTRSETEFEIVSGSGFGPGMLLREI